MQVTGSIHFVTLPGYVIFETEPKFKPVSNFILIVPRRCFCGGSNCFMFWRKILCCLRVLYVFIRLLSLGN